MCFTKYQFDPFQAIRAEYEPRFRQRTLYFLFPLFSGPNEPMKLNKKTRFQDLLCCLTAESARPKERVDPRRRSSVVNAPSRATGSRQIGVRLLAALFCLLSGLLCLALRGKLTFGFGMAASGIIFGVLVGIFFVGEHKKNLHSVPLSLCRKRKFIKTRPEIKSFYRCPCLKLAHKACVCSFKASISGTFDVNNHRTSTKNCAHTAGNKNQVLSTPCFSSILHSLRRRQGHRLRLAPHPDPGPIPGLRRGHRAGGQLPAQAAPLQPVLVLRRQRVRGLRRGHDPDEREPAPGLHGHDLGKVHGDRKLEVNYFGLGSLCLA